MRKPSLNISCLLVDYTPHYAYEVRSLFGNYQYIQMVGDSSQCLHEYPIYTAIVESDPSERRRAFLASAELLMRAMTRPIHLTFCTYDETLLIQCQHLVNSLRSEVLTGFIQFKKNRGIRFPIDFTNR